MMFCAGWITVQRDVEITHDLEKTPLEISTNSEISSGESIYVKFLTDQSFSAGGLLIKLSGTPSYIIVACKTVDVTSTLPTKKEKIWRITLTRAEPEVIRLRMHCNDVEMFDFVLSDTTCDVTEWKTTWNRDVGKIKFLTSDAASDFYRTYTGK